MSGTPLTWNQTVKGITEFIEVAIHTILYVRQIYPADLFVRRKKYDTPVFQARHPALNEYISGTIKAVSDELVLGNVDKVVVVIKDRKQVALERFIFSVQNMIEVESYNKDTSVQDAMSSAKLGQYFRSFLIKLNMIESQLGLLELPSGDEASFAIVLELKENTVPSASKDNFSFRKEPPPWVPADRQHTTSGASEDAQLHLLRAVDTGIINISLAVQESEQKLQHTKNPDNSTYDIEGQRNAEASFPVDILDHNLL
ncbi:DNA-binding protein [Suillus lakei]|nr:DNA-binding protein [Suillus lakei]